MRAKSVFAGLCAIALFVAAPVAAQNPLHVPSTVNELRIADGHPGDLVGVFFGFEEQRFMIPGNAWVLLNPVATYVLGRFDPGGEYVTELRYEGPAVEPIDAFVQAVSYNEEFDTFRTSGLCHLRFDGVFATEIMPR